MLVPHEIQGLFDFSNGAGALPAEISGRSTIQIVCAFLEHKPTSQFALNMNSNFFLLLYEYFGSTCMEMVGVEKAFL